MLRRMRRKINNLQLKSERSSESSYVKFINKTTNDVEIFWVNFSGRRTKYGILKPNEFLDVNTFTKHPWLCCDLITRLQINLNGELVFLPKATDPQIPRRTIVNITMPLMTLYDLCMQRILRQFMAHKLYLLTLPVSKQIKCEIVEDLRFIANDF